MEAFSIMEIIYQSSAVGVFRTVLIVVFLVVLVRFIGKIVIARRNIQEQHNINAKQANQRRAQQKSRENRGKVTISNDHSKAEDVDYEEV